MQPRTELPGRNTQPFPKKPKKSILPQALAVAAGLVILLIGGIVIAMFSTAPQGEKSNKPAPGKTPATTPVATPVSPLLFGTNMGLFDKNDQVLTSATTRQILQQQLKTPIIRMPLRDKLPDEVTFQAARTIKSLGAIPLVILQGDEINPKALELDTRIIKGMNTIFGKSIVYYEYGNEEDLLGVPKDQYTESWNRLVPQLKKIAQNGHFIGPVNYEYDDEYLFYFLKHAQPLPDEVSWHEYTCDSKWEASRCLANIDNWNRHIADARSLMREAIGKELPIMITEWNYAPNAKGDDGKNNDSTFMSNWTTKALQTLAANRIFASMQYSLTNTAIPLINHDVALTPQGMAFQTQYQRMIIQGQAPIPVIGTAIASSTKTTTSTEVTGSVAFSFEDGSTANWQAHSKSISGLENSSSVVKEGKHALKLRLANSSTQSYPYISADLSSRSSLPGPGQKISAYIYSASNSVSLTAKIFVTDSSGKWHTGNSVELSPGRWTQVSFTVPSDVTEPGMLGIQFNSPTAGGISSDVYIDAVGWT
jgi:hypothetical protein